jgi:transcriptional regulator with XRE-family HTH domain
MPTTSRRRATGLRREEVAILAGVSVTWYTHLEQGRGGDVSPAVLDGVARALKLNEDERRYMHHLMYGRVMGPRPLDGKEALVEPLRKIIDLENANPYPVYLIDGACDLLAWNDAAVEWYDDWGGLSGEKRNLLVWMLTVPAARRRIVNWEATARDVVMQWRAHIARKAEDGRSARLIGYLEDKSPEFRSWWSSYLVLEHRIRTWILNHPKDGERALHSVPVSTFYEDDPLIVFHVPA